MVIERYKLTTTSLETQILNTMKDVVMILTFQGRLKV